MDPTEGARAVPARHGTPPSPPPRLPPPPAAPSGSTHARPQPGQLTPGWRVATAIVWALVFVGLIAVWKTSRELGLATWWLGPIGDPTNPIVSTVPFLPAVAMLLLTANNFRWIPWAGVVAAAAVAVVGLIDLGYVVRLGIVELAIAAAGALTSFAGFAGRYRTR